MQVAFIEPLAHIAEDFVETGWHMILPEACSLSEEYVQYYTRTEGYKILDNGIVEGEALDWDDLIQLAYDLEVDEIVVPDVLKGSNASQRMAIQFGKWLLRHYPSALEDFRFMGAVQGTTMAEVMSSFQTLAGLNYIQVLGLPRSLSSIHPWIRPNFLATDTVQSVCAANFSGGVHCLGAHAFIKEPLLLADLPVRSMDTSLVAAMSLREGHIGRFPYVERPENFWTSSYPSLDLAAGNHLTYVDWALGSNWYDGGL